MTGQIAHKGEKAPIQAGQRWPVHMLSLCRAHATDSNNIHTRRPRAQNISGIPIFTAIDNYAQTARGVTLGLSISA
jgi:hypothetical protein